MEKRKQAGADTIDQEQIRQLVSRIVQSPPFERSARMQGFLRYLVDETLEGRGHQIKEYGVAVSVFGKGVDFDPGTTAVVRVEAGRLRRLLGQYQLDHASNDPIRIIIPKGSYTPLFEFIEKVTLEASPSRDEPIRSEMLPGVQSTANAERRLVTVLSCTLDRALQDGELDVDSDFLLGFDAFHAMCSQIAHKHGVGLDGGASDRLIMYFGWPDPIEDSVGRALTVALDIVDQAAMVLPQPWRGVRLAVATGEVAVREGSSGGAASPVIVGKAPSLAFKIMHHAAANSILVSDGARRLAGASFEFIPADAAGVCEPGLVPLWRLLRARSEDTRFQAAAGTLSGSIIGRREELSLLMSRWSLAREGEGQAALLIGEAGIGKSRLAEEVLDSIAGAAKVMRIQCSPHHTNTALFPWIELLRSESRLDTDSSLENNRLHAFLARFGLEEGGNLDLLAALLSLQPSGSAGRPSASRQKDLTLNLLADLIFAHVEQGCLVLLIEDLHWADPTTIELLHALLAGIWDARLLLIMTSRPDAAIASLRQTSITSIRLPRLPKSDCLLLVDRMTASAAIHERVRGRILEKGEGVPLFIEELTKLVLSSQGGRADLLPLPDRLSDLLAGQFSRLGSARAVAQIASVIGRQFSLDMLAQSSGLSRAAIEEALDQLHAAGIITKQGGDRLGLYMFRHALFCDAAYNSLLNPARKQLHARLVETILGHFPEFVSEQPEVVANHSFEAGRYADAAGFWLEAGKKAAQAYALDEAMNAFRQALAALELLPSEASLKEKELEALLLLGQAIRHAKGYGDNELLVIYQRARDIASSLAQPMAIASSIYGLWTHAAGHGDWQNAVALATEFEHLTRTIDDDGQYAAEASRLLGAGAAFQGQFSLARHYFEGVLAHYDEEKIGPGLGYDPGAVCAAYLAWTRWHQGELASARDAAREALRLADYHRHPLTTALVLAWLIFHALCEKDVAAVRRLNARLQVICAERECRYWQPLGAAAAAWAEFQIAPDEKHIATLIESAGAFRERYLTSCLLLLGAEMSGILDNPDYGLELVSEAKAFIQAHDERIWEAEAYRLSAELSLLKTEPDIGFAMEQAQLAQRIATKQNSVSLLKRAEATLAHVEKASR